jgi:hypothetical protein
MVDPRSRDAHRVEKRPAERYHAPAGAQRSVLLRDADVRVEVPAVAAAATNAGREAATSFTAARRAA